MKRFIFAFFILAFTCGIASAEKPSRYAIAISPAPVLNTPHFTKAFGGELRLDPCRGVRPIEFVALTGTLFKVVGEEQDDGVTVLRVTTNDYPYPSKTGYYVDARFVQPVETPVERPRKLPELVVVQQRLLAALGKPYVWGGDVKDGLPLLTKLYPHADPLAGVDCSGLLYQATDGFTPRNTNALTSYGAGVDVAGLSPEKIAEKLQPLDLIVWKGHVMIVLDGDSIIQSTMGCRGGGGVHLSPIKETLRRLMKSKKPANSYAAGKFLVRRWFPR